MIFLLSVVHLLINAREIMIFSTLPSHNEVTVTSMVQESSRLENSINGTKFNLESKIKILNFHILNLEEKEEDLNYYLIEKLKNLEFKEKFQIESNLNCITQQKSTSDRNFVAVGSCFHQIKKRIKENESFKLELNFITRLIQILLIMLYKLRHLQNVDERRCSRRYDLISQDINDGNLDLDGNIYLIIQFKMIIFQFGLKNFFFRFKIPKVLKINVFYINPNSDINASALEEEPLPLYTPRYTPST
ncbi:hypothetical protein HDU92_000270 [Lobulomyces angularis]|nr:hypothetical protein HDU92_000270 [Lobulomyces angularis]